jgi:hypothetical protein
MQTAASSQVLLTHAAAALPLLLPLHCWQLKRSTPVLLLLLLV